MIERKVEDRDGEDQITRLRYMIDEQSKLIGMLFQKLYENKTLNNDDIREILPYDVKMDE